MGKTYNDGVKDCMAVIQKRVDDLTQKETETFRDPASGRSETIKKGEWTGSAYEHQLFTGLLAKFSALL